MTILLDTCIVIDALRQRPEAVTLIRSLSRQPIMSVVTISELRAGQRGLRDKRQIDEALANSTLIDATCDIAEIAGDLLRQFSKSHALDLPDALIAATALHHSLELATLNVKHFPMFAGLKPAY